MAKWFCQNEWQAENFSLTEYVVISKKYMVLLKKWRNFALPRRMAQ